MVKSKTITSNNGRYVVDLEAMRATYTLETLPDRLNLDRLNSDSTKGYRAYVQKLLKEHGYRGFIVSYDGVRGNDIHFDIYTVLQWYGV